MRKILLVVALLAFVTGSFAQSEKYVKAMTNAIQQIDSSKSADDMLAASAAFERIAEAEKTQWLPYYYAAYTQTIAAFIKNKQDMYDGYADKATSYITKAEALEKSNSEISCLKSLIATLRMLVDPAQRWMQYSKEIDEALELSKKQDPTNPRPYYLQGQNLRGTPEQFGGGCATAKPVLEEAVKRYATFKPASPLSPTWGKKQTEETLAGCK
ncbi:MAG: hypothetical protein QM731_17305 [Chitinophagaceae bacterium]